MKTIFITGASTGLGKATALLFHSHGWQVIATLQLQFIIHLCQALSKMVLEIVTQQKSLTCRSA